MILSQVIESAHRGLTGAGNRGLARMPAAAIAARWLTRSALLGEYRSPYTPVLQ